MTAPIFPRAVLFDLLTALLDSWTAWNAAVGSEAQGRAWRAAYLRMTLARRTITMNLSFSLASRRSS